MVNKKSEISPDELTFLSTLISDFPTYRFRLNSKRFSYRPIKNTSNSAKSARPTIFIGPPQPNFALLTLHELGHAISNHKDYKIDVSRLKIESEAWQVAKTLYSKYQKSSPSLLKNLPWDEEFVQDSLDTYRNWLHQKSLCKTCGLTRYQTPDELYHCPHCEKI